MNCEQAPDAPIPLVPRASITDDRALELIDEAALIGYLQMRGWSRQKPSADYACCTPYTIPKPELTVHAPDKRRHNMIERGRILTRSFDTLGMVEGRSPIEVYWDILGANRRSRKHAAVAVPVEKLREAAALLREGAESEEKARELAGELDALVRPPRNGALPEETGP